jgi:CubicO group peptidase (beta-lactamase class C family)
MTDTPFDLFHAPGLTAVANAFRKNFEEDMGNADRAVELGAQFAVYRRGELLLDFKGGWADRAKTTEVTDKTLMAVYSSGKVAAALVIAWLADQDRLGYDQIAATIWPEFAAHGKDKLTIAQLLSHQAGLSGITAPDWQAEDWYDWDKTCSALAAQKPIFPPGSASGYHPVTYGFLAGEIARRADREGRSLGTILREEIAAPNGLDIHIGLPETEHARCAQMIKPKRMANLGEINAATQAAFMQKSSSPSGPAARWRAAELAGSNCHAAADSLARMMQVYIDGKIGGNVILSEDMLEQARRPRISGPNLVLPFDLTIAAGIMQNAPNFVYGPTPETLGHSGWGGSCVFADPVTGLHGAYAMNRQDNSLIGDPRPVLLISALYEALETL